jgi:2-polyprenyl-6-methoxyphenol hydroxylase-like FAD-dependent oxidoreductase
MTVAAAGPTEADRPDLPVVVIGGGPVGLALAMELHHHGVGCTVIEPRPSVSVVRPRAKTTSARTMELFRRWGFAECIRARAPIPVSWSSDVVFCTTAAGAEVTRFTGTLGLALTGDDLVAEPGQQVGQPVVEQALRDALAELPDVRLRFGSRAIGVNQDRDGVTVQVEDAGGAASAIRARYAVGADGARSVVRPAIGAVYEGGNAGRPNLSIVFRSVGLGSLIPDRAVHRWVLNPAAPGVVGPMDLDDVWWAIATGRPDDDRNADPVAIVRAMVGADIDVEVLGTDPWQARSLLATAYQRGRLLLAGDAAHQNPPWGGHGFNTGVGDAVNLGWKLAAVLRGWAPAELLDSYEAERRPVAADTISIAGQNARTLATELASEALMGGPESFAAARPAAAETVQRMKHIEFHCLGLVLGYGYGRRSAEQTADGSDFHPVAAVGNRLPHHWLAPGDSLYDHLGPGFTVLGADPAVAALVTAADRRGVPVSQVGAELVDTGARYGADVVLVRPDQHIAWLGGPLSARAAETVLDAVLRHGLLDDATSTGPGLTAASNRSDQ